MSSSVTSSPLLLPARMVNEYVYCPRLFYFEFVEGVFANNADKVAGKACSFGNLARKRVFSAYEQRLSEGLTHPVFGYRICYRRAIELQARLLAKSLTGDIEQYIPFLTR